MPGRPGQPGAGPSLPFAADARTVAADAGGRTHRRPAVVRDDGAVTRIVAGRAGGRRLAVPARGTRPTSERVREALFSALDAAVTLDGAVVLDLYAGSGALGLEALSRGAAEVTFVESQRAAVSVLRRNIEAVGAGAATVIAKPVLAALRASPRHSVDVVLADPPYALAADELRAVLDALVRHGWTTVGTVVVIERAVRAAAPQWPAPLRPLRDRCYGDTVLHWAEHAQHDGDGESHNFDERIPR